MGQARLSRKDRMQMVRDRVRFGLSNVTVSLDNQPRIEPTTKQTEPLPAFMLSAAPVDIVSTVINAAHEVERETGQAFMLAGDRLERINGAFLSGGKDGEYSEVLFPSWAQGAEGVSVTAPGRADDRTKAQTGWKAYIPPRDGDNLHSDIELLIDELSGRATDSKRGRTVRSGDRITLVTRIFNADSTLKEETTSTREYSVRVAGADVNRRMFRNGNAVWVPRWLTNESELEYTDRAVTAFFRLERERFAKQPWVTGLITPVVRSSGWYWTWRGTDARTGMELNTWEPATSRVDHSAVISFGEPSQDPAKALAIYRMIVQSRARNEAEYEETQRHIMRDRYLIRRDWLLGEYLKGLYAIPKPRPVVLPTRDIDFPSNETPRPWESSPTPRPSATPSYAFIWRGSTLQRIVPNAENIPYQPKSEKGRKLKELADHAYNQPIREPKLKDWYGRPAMRPRPKWYTVHPIPTLTAPVITPDAPEVIEPPAAPVALPKGIVSYQYHVGRGTVNDRGKRRAR